MKTVIMSLFYITKSILICIQKEEKVGEGKIPESFSQMCRFGWQNGFALNECK